MVPEVGIAPTSPPLQGGANLPQLLGEMVVPRGNAPHSLAYQASALLLSYRTGKVIERRPRGTPLDRLDLIQECHVAHRAALGLALLRTGSCRAHNQCGPLGRSDSNDTIWFIALAKEHLAAIANNWFHEDSFRFGIVKGTTTNHIRQ